MFRTTLSLDRANKTLTVVVGALVGAVAAVTLASGREAARLPLAFTLGVLALSFMMAPRALVVTDGQIRIERRLWRPLIVPLADVERASPIDSLGPRAMRLFGVGGFFGSYGLFSSEKLGRFRLYATHGGQAVLVTRRTGLLPIVVTPDDVAGTIAAIDPRPTPSAPAN
jgi:hypothetical protein